MKKILRAGLIGYGYCLFLVSSLTLINLMVFGIEVFKLMYFKILIIFLIGGLAFSFCVYAYLTDIFDNIITKMEKWRNEKA